MGFLEFVLGAYRSAIPGLKNTAKKERSKKVGALHSCWCTILTVTALTSTGAASYNDTYFKAPGKCKGDVLAKRH